MSEKCGTYAGWNSHRYHGEEVCDACRKAQSDYQRARRLNNPKAREADRKAGRVRSAALWRLADMHRTDFELLVADELRVEAQRTRASNGGVEP